MSKITQKEKAKHNFIIYILIPFFVWITIILLTLKYSDFLSIFLIAFMVSLMGFTITFILKRNWYGRGVKSSRNALHKLIIIFAKAMLIATSLVGLLMAFVDGDIALVVIINEEYFISVRYITQYLIIYAIMYGLIWSLTYILVNFKHV